MPGLMPATRSCSPPLRLALVWGGAAAVLGLLAVVLLFWVTGATDDGMLCAPGFEGRDLACRLHDAWLSVLRVAAVLAAASLLAGIVAVVTGRRSSGPSGAGSRGTSC
jgi:hypothetical protein